LKAVLFDMDGVLVLTEPLHLRAWIEYVKRKNSPLPQLLSLDTVTGLSDEKLAIMLKDACGFTCSPDDMCAEKEKLFLDILSHEKVDSLSGRDDFLEYCKANFIIGVVSSSSKSEVKRTLIGEGIAENFQFIVSRGDTARHKPAPDPYLLALKKAGVKPREALAIEDSAHGLEAALAAGINVFAMSTGDIDSARFPDVEMFDDFCQVQKTFASSIDFFDKNG